MRGPSAWQERWIWNAVTVLSWGVILVVVVGVTVLGMWIASRFYGVLLPLGVASVIAFIVEPVIGLMAKGGLRRSWAVLIVGGVLLLGITGLGVWFVPKFISQIMALTRDLPDLAVWVKEHVVALTKAHPHAEAWMKAQAVSFLENLPGWLQRNMGALVKPLEQFWSAVGLALGFLLVPVYVFYLLVEKESIESRWRDFVPWRETMWGKELVWVIEQVHGYLVTFFRGQVVVAFIVGVLTAVGLTLIGLPYALLFGVVCGILSIVPYLGVVVSIIPALILAWVNTEHWVQPCLVVAVFGVVQFVEGIFISPRVLGNRTGLHPMTVIVAILVWSQILPGLLGAILAIPLTATLRVVLYRYVWLRRLPAEFPLREESERS
ncbi:MAG: AI-2E family transporter [Methylacidiphilales bacterium]|nr:AI-2E family transporter [Candidatus Methylacidiphilales bacterium]MDW8349265.1 AI-2E family transporter [Verrucomicrobiae bacterium]